MPAVTAGSEFSPSQLNFFKFASIVFDEFPKALRHVFKTMWDTKYEHQPWDDSITVRKQLRASEGDTTDIPTEKSYNEWDCTALFQATIHASTFKDAVSSQTLFQKYLKCSMPPPGTFRHTVTSKKGVQEQTFALAIDQIRLLRNEVAHSFDTHCMDITTFHFYLQHAKMAFKALGYSTVAIDGISKVPESHFLTKRLAELEEKVEEMQDERSRSTLLEVLKILLLVFTVFGVFGLYFPHVITMVSRFILGFFKPSGFPGTI